MEKLAWRAVAFLALRKRWMVGGGEVGMAVPVVALAARMTLGSGWEAVPPLSFLVHLALGGDDGMERFGCVQPGCNVCKDVREAHVVLWGRRGRLWKMHICPSLEPDACSLFYAKKEWRRDNSGGIFCDGLKEGQDVVAIDCDGCQPLGGSRLGRVLLVLTGILCLSGSGLGGGLFRFSCLLCFRFFRRFHHHNNIVVASLVVLAWGRRVRCPLRDGTGKYPQ